MPKRPTDVIVYTTIANSNASIHACKKLFSTLFIMSTLFLIFPRRNHQHFHTYLVNNGSDGDDGGGSDDDGSWVTSCVCLYTKKDKAEAF